MFFAGRVINASNPRPRERDMSTSIVKRIAGLHRLSAAELKDRWLQMVRSDPPPYNREFLVRRLAPETLHPERGSIGGSAPYPASAGMIIPAPPTAHIPGPARNAPGCSHCQYPAGPARSRGGCGGRRLSPPETKSPGTPVPGAVPLRGSTGGGSPLSGFRRDDNPGATYRPHPRPRLIATPSSH